MIEAIVDHLSARYNFEKVGGALTTFRVSTNTNSNRACYLSGGSTVIEVCVPNGMSIKSAPLFSFVDLNDPASIELLLNKLKDILA